MYPDKTLYAVMLSVNDSISPVKRYVWAESDIQVEAYAQTAYEPDVQGIINAGAKPYIVESDWGIVDHSQEPPTLINPDVVHVPTGIEFGWSAPQDSRTSHLRPSWDSDEENYAEPLDYEEFSVEADIHIDGEGDIEINLTEGEDEG